MENNPQSPAPASSQESPSSGYLFLIAFVAAVGGFLFGYDLNIIAGAQQYLRDHFTLSDKAFGFAMASALIGCLCGPFVGAWVCDKIGRRKSLIFASILFGVSAIGTAVPDRIADSLAAILPAGIYEVKALGALLSGIGCFNVFRIIGGIGVGLASVASPMYIAEIAPKKIRGMLVTMNQMAIVVGSLCAIIVAYLLAEHVENYQWNWMFASELVPIIMFVIFLCLVPETPRWLAERRRVEEASAVLTRLHGAAEARREIAEINDEIEHEKHTPKVSISELFGPAIKIAVFIGVVLSLMSQWTGWSMTAFYMPTIYAQAGIDDPAKAVFWTIVPNIANLIFTIIAIASVDRAGRRLLYLICTLAMTVTMSMLGLIFVFGIQGWPVVLVLSLTAAPHAIGMGALSWLVVSEIFPTRTRALAMSFCAIWLWIGCWIVTFLAPVLFTLSNKLLGVPSGVFFLCALVSFLSFFFILKMLPETKGRSLEEIAKSWARKES